MIFFSFFIFGAAAFYLHRFFPLSAFFLVFLCASWLVWRHRSDGARQVVILIVVVAALAGLGWFRAAHDYRLLPPLEDLAGETLSISGYADGMAVPSVSAPDRCILPFRVESAKLGDRSIPLDAVRLVTDCSFRSDKRYALQAQLPPDLSTLNPGATTGLLTAFVAGSTATADKPRSTLEAARDRLNEKLLDSFPGDTGAFLMSIITGERGSMTKEMRDAFNATGLVHILSISGAHFGLLLFILFRIFRLLIRLLPARSLERLSLICSPSQAAAVLCLPVITAYLGLSTMSFPAVRAFIMISLFLLGLLIERRGFWLTALLFAAALIVLIDPASLIDLSFQLSFIAVLGLGLLAQVAGIGRNDDEETGAVPVRPQESRLRRMAWTAGKALAASSAVSLAASGVTAPLVASQFHYASLISPLTNLVITPLMGFVVLPLGLFASFCYLLTSYFPFPQLIEKMTALSLDMTRLSAAIPFAEMKIAAFPPILLVVFYATLIWFTVRVIRPAGDKAQRSALKKGFIAACGIALVPMVVYGIVVAVAPNGMRATFLDVGQGDAAVIELPDGKVVVLDTGRRGAQVADYLSFRGKRGIDLLIISHGHPDHGGGLPSLLERYPVRELWDNGLVEYDRPIPEGIVHRTVARGDMLDGSGYRFMVLHPYEGFYTDGSSNQQENDASLVIRIEGHGASVMFTGDISAAAETDIAHLGPALKSTVLKVPHHGSRTSLSLPFLETVAPEITIVSAGRRNRYGHPKPETIELLAPTRLFRTDRDGAVGVRVLPDRPLAVRTGREARLEVASDLATELANITKLFAVW